MSTFLFLSFLQHVHEVVIGAPYKITEELLDHFNIDLVVAGKTHHDLCHDGTDPYEVAMCLFMTILICFL